MREVAARSATRAALLLALLGSLAGCGQKGPLYLPHGAPAAAARPATAARPAPAVQGTPAAPALSAASAPAAAAASGDAGPANPAAAAR
ncbi:MAG: lipoprotein [Burkholderiales bacterium]|nr:lipoprotein [Burkholderiales bacterium]